MVKVTHLHIKFIKALVDIKLKTNDKNLIKLIKKFIKDENMSDVGKSHITRNDDFSDFI